MKEFGKYFANDSLESLNDNNEDDQFDIIKFIDQMSPFGARIGAFIKKNNSKRKKEKSNIHFDFQQLE